MQIISAMESNIPHIHHFLQKHEETSQFLLNNLAEHGPHLTEHQNSGNYKILKQNNEIVGIFVLARRGNLLIECSPQVDFAAILQNALSENIEIKGFIGKWFLITELYQRYIQINPAYKPSLFSKEILYRLNLPLKNTTHNETRILHKNDFEGWITLSDLYCEELDIPIEFSREKRQQIFEARSKEKRWWGLFSTTGQLISMAGLNSTNATTGQVGGVFTLPEFRKQGYSKKVMLKLLDDCYKLHGHQKSILFTGEDSYGAQKLYESIGYEQIGDFGLILS